MTNPLFPISKLHSVVLNGKVDSKPFRTETTLLPNTRFIEWIDGQRVVVVVSQYTAYLDGRLEEEEEAGVRGTGLLFLTNQSIRCDCQRLSNRQQWRLTIEHMFDSMGESRRGRRKALPHGSFRPGLKRYAGGTAEPSRE